MPKKPKRARRNEPFPATFGVDPVAFNEALRMASLQKEIEAAEEAEEEAQRPADHDAPRGAPPTKRLH